MATSLAVRQQEYIASRLQYPNKSVLGDGQTRTFDRPRSYNGKTVETPKPVAFFQGHHEKLEPNEMIALVTQHPVYAVAQFFRRHFLQILAQEKQSDRK